jgi:DNA polymerase I
MTSSRPMFYVIDGHALAYRQFFALNAANFTTRAGEPTNAIFGFARTLLDILQKDKPDYLAVSFDMGLSGRDQLYGEYKGTRDKMPDELESQITRIMEMVEAFNIPILASEGYEADDVIGSIVPQAEAEQVHLHIITGDRDILQLLTENVTVQLPKRNEADVVYDVAKFREEYGLEPWQLVELKALMGDTSDNIPGVKGVGDKTATQLLQQFGSLDEIYAHISEVKGALQKKLIDGQESAYLSRELATIQKNVPITLNLPACVSHDYDAEKVAELFRELEFRSLSDRLRKVQPQASASANQQLSLFTLAEDTPTSAPIENNTDIQTVIVQDESTLQALVETLNKAAAISFDVESTSVDQMAANLVGIALAVDGQTGYYIPVGHQGAGDLFAQNSTPDESERQLPLEMVIGALRGPLTDPNIPKVAHNAVYDLVVLQRYGIDVAPITFDTMIAEWLVSQDGKFLGLKNLARQELGIEMTEISSLIGTGKKQVTMDKVEIKRAAPYAAADAAVTFRLVERKRAELVENGLTELMNTMEMPLVPVIAAIERAGVVLDTDHLQRMSNQLAQEMARLEEEIYGYSGGYGRFNINSPKQLNDVLFGKLGLSVAGLRKTSHGYSTDAAVLEELKGKHPIVDLLLQYRELSKLKGTYVDALPALINPETGRLHTSFNQTGTTTGRVSSNNPNLQNIPARTELGREVRRAFIAAKGCKVLSVDYSQVELRILAHVSQEPTLMEAFAQGQDIHAATAAAVYGVPLESVTYEQRSFAKRVNFGLLYGMGAFRLARDSDLTLAEADAFIKTYFQRLPRVRAYLDGTKQLAREQGYLTTLFGRRRNFPVLKNAGRGSNQQVVARAEREAINMPIQGTAADIIKTAMIQLHAELERRKLESRMILQVHDELVLEVPEHEVPETAALVVALMEGAYPLNPALKANAQVGDNWRDMSAVKS